MQTKPNNAINSDVKKLRRSFLAMQLFAAGYGWRYGEKMKIESRVTKKVLEDYLFKNSGEDVLFGMSGKVLPRESAEEDSEWIRIRDYIMEGFITYRIRGSEGIRGQDISISKLYCR